MRPTVKLGEICDILDKKRKPITQKDRTKGIYPYYGASGILDYVADYIFDEDLVLIGEDGAKRGALDNSAFKVSGKVWVNNHAHVIRPHREKIIDDFLVYFLVSSDLSDYITGTTVPKLNQERLKLIEIPLPPLETQKAIVAKLDQIFAELDQTKSEIQKNLDNTDELWKSALNQAFQGDWEMKKLREVCKIERGGSPRPIQEFLTTAENGVNWIKIGDTKTQPKYIEFTQEKIKPEGVKRSRMVYPGDFILSNSMSFGRPYIMKTSGCIHDGRLVLRPDNTVDKEFLYYLLGSDFMYKKFENTASGTGVKNLNIDKVKVIEIAIPPLSEQEKIVEHLDQVSQEVEELKSKYESQLDNLEELKKSVLDKAFKGELVE